MNPLSRPRQQQQKTLRIKKQENTLEFHSRLIEAAEVRVCETHRFAVSLEGAAVYFQPPLRDWVVLSNPTQD
jgi:hypothetical protein